MIDYRNLAEQELTRTLFAHFIRHQVVRECWRKRDGAWVIEEDPFIDDWSEADYEELIADLRRTVSSGGLVRGAFQNGALKGFAAVTPDLFGGPQCYLDLTNLHASEDARRLGIGTALFRDACSWAAAHGAKKLYLSAHSAVETQAFYRFLGCVEACVYSKTHVESEPFDCQMEYELDPR